MTVSEGAVGEVVVDLQVDSVGEVAVRPQLDVRSELPC